jgi:hypothetical protein
MLWWKKKWECRKEERVLAAAAAAAARQEGAAFCGAVFLHLLPIIREAALFFSTLRLLSALR